MKGELVVNVESRAERTAQVTLEGSLDGHTFDRFRDSMTGLIKAGAQPHVMKIFKMLGLLEILILVSTPEEAWVTLKARLGRSPQAGEDGVPLIG